MRILSVSDRVEPALYDRFDPDRFGRVDLVLACGDLPPEYLSFLTGALQAPVFFVKGNHDIRYDSKSPQGCLDIHARIVRFKGLNFLGLEGSRWYNGGPYQYTESQMWWTLFFLTPTLWLKRGIDVVITHAPPRHVHDAEDMCHRGFRVYNRLIKKYAPKYFIHGHIHEHFSGDSQRISLVRHTKVINTYRYYLFETEDE